MLSESEKTALVTGATHYGELHALYLYGSEATGRARAGSDLDLAVLFDRPLDSFQMIQLASDLSPFYSPSLALL